MCGIFGCVGEIEKDKIEACIAQIRHRGPDAVGIELLPGCSLAHTRLSILDVSDNANQPMPDASGRYWIVYNGEVYNYLELRKELERLGYHFRTNCDTEVVLYSYIQWGKEFQNKCNGMWGVAIWDDLKKELFLSRDRFGIKPLYYLQQDGNFYFASEMKAFFPIMKQKKINHSIFEKKNYFAYEATEYCCIKEIKKIAAGHYAYVKEGTVCSYRWWNTMDNLVEVPDRYEEQVEMLRELLLDACRIRMRSDVPIGTALSGGVDSSAVIGAMNTISGTNESTINKEWQNAFVASMPGTTIDETYYAQKAADHVGVELQKVKVSADISADTIMKYMYICEEPYITSPIPFMQTYGAMAEHGIKVTIDGHGADELFGGYAFDLYTVYNDVRGDENELKNIWKTYNDMMLEEGKITYQDFCARGAQYKMGLNEMLYSETHEKTLPTLLRCYDRYSMGNSLEIRMPFMDYRIVDFAFSIPWNSKVRDGFSKKIVRDAAAPFMDEKVLFRKSKVGFNSPMTEWLHGEMKEFVLDEIHSRSFYECELINPLDVTIEVDNFYREKEKKFSDGQKIWKLLVPYLWKKAMNL